MTTAGGGGKYMVLSLECQWTVKLIVRRAILACIEKHSVLDILGSKGKVDYSVT